MKKLVGILLVTTLFCGFSNAQLCVVYDEDGYANVRKESSLKSSVIGRIIEGQAFAIVPYEQEEKNESGDWIAVKLPLTDNLKSGKFLRFDGEGKIGFVHKSRLVKLESMPHFEIVKTGENKTVHSHKNIQIAIETGVFEKTNHKVIQTKEGFFLVDGEKVFAYYGGDATEIKSISLKSKNGTHTVPESALENLFMTSALNTKVYIGNKGEYYIVFDAGDGADSYNIIYCWKKNELFSMTVTSTIP